MTGQAALNPVRLQQLKRTAVVCAVVWTAVVLVGGGWYFFKESESALQMARVHGARVLERDLETFRWFAAVGGVYVPATQETPPDPLLSERRDRDLTTTTGLELTLLNPARMIREAHELENGPDGPHAHITSLEPMRPANAPDAWEAEALRAFEHGETEVVELAKIGDVDYLRLMRPLITETDCPQCSGLSAHEPAPVRGGISVSVPMMPLWSSNHDHMATVAIGYGLVWVMGLSGIALGASRIGRGMRESVRVEQALRQSARMLLESQRVAKVGSYVLDIPSGTWESSSVLDLIFGIDEDYERSVEGWLALVHPDDRLSMADYLAHDVIEARGCFDKEYRIVRHTDGAERWVHGLGKLEIGTGERPLRMVGTIQDVTERMRAKVERERLFVAIEQTAEAVCITDQAGTIQYVNPAFEQITGYSREEAIGQNPRILKSGEQDDAFYREMWDTLLGGGAWARRFVNRKKDGTMYTEDSVISPVRGAAGKTINYVAVKHDVTKELEMEEQLRQAQKMESVGRLAGGVAHDFNNMLAVILGNIEVAMESVEEHTPVHANLIEVRAAAERSADLTRQLLAFARKQTVVPTVLDLNETVGGMISMLRRLIGEEIDFAWLPGARVWPVKVDPSQIDQILANLCVNSRDAIDGVGRVVIETANVTLDRAFCADHPGCSEGEYALLSVSDDGAGMDKAILGRLYEPFFTTKETGVGTGLGLSTVYGIVKQNSGFIDVYSERGQGTTFKVYLPRHHSKSEPAKKDEPAQPMERGGETILVVEDEAAILQLVTTMLLRQGYTVLAASTPEEAIGLASAQPGEIQLLVTDVVMPEMNGRELADKLLSQCPSLKCLFMSGYTADAIADRGGVLDEGVQFIQKPFTMTALATQVRAVLDGQPRGDGAGVT